MRKKSVDRHKEIKIASRKTQTTINTEQSIKDKLDSFKRVTWTWDEFFIRVIKMLEQRTAQRTD
jgi:hypothetical protein|tara:strand:- start:543 stop:734 length:192 start_codon:yes stop_codon:yes gene_type:complete